jgi:hypothetical protein
MLIAETEIRFSWASLLTTVMMTGIHPFQIMDETGDKTLNDCIADQKLPFGSKNQRSQAKTSRFARNLWSNMPRFVKTVLWDTLTVEPEKRYSLDKLANTARAYLHWLHNEAEQFPEADSLEPQLLKPMYVVGICGHQFDLANEGGYSTKNDEGEEVYLCPECAAQPVIAQCGHELPMTKKEVFLGIKTAFKMCPDCFRKKQGWNPASAPVEPVQPAPEPVQPAPEPVQPAPKPVQPAPKPAPAPKKPAAKPSMMPEQPPIKKGESDNVIFEPVQMLIRHSHTLAREFVDFLNSL